MTTAPAQPPRAPEPLGVPPRRDTLDKTLRDFGVEPAPAAVPAPDQPQPEQVRPNPLNDPIARYIMIGMFSIFIGWLIVRSIMAPSAAPAAPTAQPTIAITSALAAAAAPAPSALPTGITTARTIVPRWAPNGDARPEAIERGTVVRITGQHSAFPGWVLIAGDGIADPSWVQLADLAGAPASLASVADLAPPPTPIPAPVQVQAPAAPAQAQQAQPQAEPTRCVDVTIGAETIQNCGTLSFNDLEATARAALMNKLQLQQARIETPTPYGKK